MDEMIDALAMETIRVIMARVNSKTLSERDAIWQVQEVALARYRFLGSFNSAQRKMHRILDRADPRGERYANAAAIAS